MWVLVIVLSASGSLNNGEQLGAYGPYPTLKACTDAGKKFERTHYMPNGTHLDVTSRNAVSGCAKLHEVEATKSFWQRLFGN
jgi:hypothetical protein